MARISPSTLTAGSADPIAAAEAARFAMSVTGNPVSRASALKRICLFRFEGQPLRDRIDLSRIKAVAIPPAWTGVWICSKANGHLQATGRDARGRKQYRYHARWREIRDENKYQRMIAFAQALPAIRASVQRDLTLFGLPRAKVLATIVKLLESTHIRVGI